MTGEIPTPKPVPPWAALVVRTAERLTHARIDHVAMIEFEGFVSLTQDLEGVTVNNRTAFTSHGSATTSADKPFDRIAFRTYTLISAPGEERKINGRSQYVIDQAAVMELSQALRKDTMAEYVKNHPPGCRAQ